MLAELRRQHLSSHSPVLWTPAYAVAREDLLDVVGEGDTLPEGADLVPGAAKASCRLQQHPGTFVKNLTRPSNTQACTFSEMMFE